MLRPLTQILGMVLNMSHFRAPDTGNEYPLFGPPAHFDELAQRLDVPILARVPLEMAVSHGGDAGLPEVLRPQRAAPGTSQHVFLEMARRTWDRLAYHMHPTYNPK